MGRHSAQEPAAPESATTTGAAAGRLSRLGRSKQVPRLSRIQWILSVFLLLSGVATAVGLGALWPAATDVAVSPDFAATSHFPKNQVNGTVAVRDQGPCASPSIGRVFDTAPVSPLDKQGTNCERAIVDLTSGTNAGKRTLLMVGDHPGDPELHQGEKIRLAEQTAADGQLGYTFTDYQRGTSLVVWLVVTALAIVLIGSWRGARSLVGLVITMTIVGVFLIPALLRGGDPLALAVVAGAAILFLALYLVHGFSWKTSSALAGTLISMALAAVMAKFAISGTQLRGLGQEDNLLIQLYLPDVTVGGLMLCGFIVGALGVLNDVTVGQASTVNELAELDPTSSPLRLFRGAMKVGQDHIASMVYTLVLSYTGAALPLLLLLSVAGRPLLETLSGDVMATELIRSAIGALGLAMAVPITTLIAAFTVTGSRENKPRE